MRPQCIPFNRSSLSWRLLCKTSPVYHLAGLPLRRAQHTGATQVEPINSSHFTEATLLHRFPDTNSKYTLTALLSLAQREASLGRWPARPEAASCQQMDGYLIDPLCIQLEMSKDMALDLVQFVCSLADELAYDCLHGSVDPLQYRLNLLNPSRISMDLLEPLSHIGIRKPIMLLPKCPALLIASATRIERTGATEDDGQPNRVSVMYDALDTLGSLLDRNDLVGLIHRYPGLLLRPADELIELHSYLVEEMGLLSSDIVRASRVRTQRHFFRHTTGLHLVRCPAWLLPLDRVRARHALAVLTGCWPLSKTVHKTIGDPNKRLAGLLTDTPARVPFWLGLRSNKSIKSNDVAGMVQLSTADVEYLQRMLSSIRDPSTDTTFPEDGSHSITEEDDSDALNL